MPQNNLNVNGLRSSASMYMVDGADVMEQFNSGTPYTPAPDAIQEFRVETNNMTAQYGGGGAILNVALKSGTNSYHGDVYEFLRNDKMDARNFFALTKPELRRKINSAESSEVQSGRTNYSFCRLPGYAGSVGCNCELAGSHGRTANRQLRRFETTDRSLHPAANSKQSNPRLPGVTATLFFLNYFPLANTTAGTYVQSATSQNNSNQFDTRLDYQLRSGPADDLHFRHAEGRCLQSGSISVKWSYLRAEPGRIHQSGLDAYFRADSREPSPRFLCTLLGVPDRPGHRNKLHGAGGHRGVSN